MKSRSSSFTSLAFSGALALLAIPALAQSSSGSGSSSTNPPVSKSGSSGSSASSSQTGQSSSSTGSMDKSSSSTGTAGSQSGTSYTGTSTAGTGTQTIAGQFNTLDTDSDGRLSMTEFNAYVSPADNPSGLTPTGRGNGNGVPSASTGGSSSTSGVSSTPGSTGMDSSTTTGASSANAQLFQQLDTNHDGYLSHSEIAATSSNASQQR